MVTPGAIVRLAKGRPMRRRRRKHRIRKRARSGKIVTPTAASFRPRRKGKGFGYGGGFGYGSGFGYGGFLRRRRKGAGFLDNLKKIGGVAMKGVGMAKRGMDTYCALTGGMGGE